MLTPRENTLIAYRHGQPEYVPCFYSDIALGKPGPGVDRPATIEPGAKDGFGVEWTYDSALKASMPKPNQYLFEDICEWREKLTIPDLDAIDWEKQAELDKTTTFAMMQPGTSYEEYVEGKFKMCCSQQGMFERMHACMGFENALASLAEDPDECYEFFGAIADHKIAFFKKIAQYYDFDGVEAHDDYGSQNSLFMSPETFRKLLKPHLKRIVDACHELGLIYQHHSCGHIEPLVEDFIDVGMDAVDTWQAVSNPNLATIKQKYQDKLCFCGGFNNTHVLDRVGVTPEEVKAEYRRTIDTLAPGGSYIAFPITATFGFVKPFMEEHFRYGKTFYENPENRRK